MTTTTADAPATEEGRSRSWESIAVGLAWEIASVNFDRGDLAALRRMDPRVANTPTLWRLLARRDLLVGQKVERKWALIIHGIALMTRTDSTAVRTAHDRAMPVGRALFEGSDPSRGTAYYSASRFSRLMTARGDMFHSLLSRMFRMMASAGQPFDWYQMARLILAEGDSDDRAERIRRIIARDYYWAEDRAARQSSQ